MGSIVPADRGALADGVFEVPGGGGARLRGVRCPVCGRGMEVRSVDVIARAARFIELRALFECRCPTTVEIRTHAQEVWNRGA